MREGLTEMVFIIDRSGSMSGLESDTVGGFNAMIEQQKELDGDALVSVVLFDNEPEVIYDRVPIQKVEPMTERQYQVCGCTALLDALGGAIHHIGNVHKYAREEDRPEKTVIVVTTDGLENTSYRYSSSKVRHMVERQQNRYGWEFVFLGANIDSVKEAGNIGIRKDRVHNYEATCEGVNKSYRMVSEEMTAIRHK